MPGHRSIHRSIALLRGINVGGKNKLPMADLREIFAAVGCTDIETYIQSGNVVFTVGEGLAADHPAAEVASRVTAEIEARFGVSIPVLTRTAAELAVVVEDNPYGGDDVPDNTLHVAFLADAPSAERIAALDPDRSPPDEFTVRGSTVYLHCPNGLARTKLSNAYFDSVLGTTSTMRNWRTTKKLLDMTR